MFSFEKCYFFFRFFPKDIILCIPPRLAIRRIAILLKPLKKSKKNFVNFWKKAKKIKRILNYFENKNKGFFLSGIFIIF